MRVGILLSGWLLAASFSMAASPEALAKQGVVINEPPPQPQVPEVVTSRPLTHLLKPEPVTSPNLSGFYEEIPESLDKAVRFVCEENYTSGTLELTRQLAEAKNSREKARVLMWLGLSAGQEAIDNPNVGPEKGTSASMYLRQAITLDPKVYEASDVVRILAEMAAHGWMPKSLGYPTTLTGAEEQAAVSGKAIDHFYAGVMLRRESIKQWIKGDTTDLDNRAYKQLSAAVEKDPERYEFWSQYLPAMMPLGFHNLMTSETEVVYRHFKALRNPLMPPDMGPVSLYLRTRQGYTMADDDQLLNDLITSRPAEPFGRYQLALWTIETTPTLAVSRFEEFVKKLEANEIKLIPREAGFRPSAYYKLAFLYEENKGLTECLALNLKVREISPTYALVNQNIAVLYTKLAERETTGPKKLELLNNALEAVRAQEQINYQGKAAAKATGLARQVMETIANVRKELNMGDDSVTTTASTH